MRYANNPLEEIISSALGEESLNKLNLEAGSWGKRKSNWFLLPKVKEKKSHPNIKFLSFREAPCDSPQME